jgi:hypothetical protein
METTEHPFLERVIQAEADKLAMTWDRSAVDRREDVTIVSGLLGDVQMEVVTVVHEDGSVLR